MPQADWTSISPYLKPLAALLDDEEVTNIDANPDGAVFYEKRGWKYRADDIHFSDLQKSIALQNIARQNGQNLTERQPYLTAQLPNGDRITGVSDRISRGGHTLTIRRFPKVAYSLSQLESFGMFSPEIGHLLRDEVAARSSILVVGSTNSGKTTLLNAMCLEIDDDQRIVTIEDIPELRIAKPDLVAMQALENTELTQVTIRDLLRLALRLNPKRIIMGEMRKGEAYDFLQCMNSGHPGSMSTIHARGALDALQRLCDLVLESKLDIPYHAIQRSIANALHLVIYQEYDTTTGRREIKEVLRVKGWDESTQKPITEFLYRKERAARVSVVPARAELVTRAQTYEPLQQSDRRVQCKHS